MFEAILMDFCWASMLLLLGMFLRAKVKIFQTLFIPVSVIGGLVGILLSHDVLGQFCPIYIHWSEHVTEYANPLLAILFVTQFLALKFDTRMLRKAFIIFCTSAVVIATQVLYAMGLGRVFNLPDGAALLPFSAFYGAHGIPQIVAGVYQKLHYWNYDAASAFGNTYATIGMLYGIIVGIAIINIGIRKGWTSASKSGNLTDEERTGILDPANRKPFMKQYTAEISMEPISFHFMVILAVMLVSYGVLKLLQMIPLFSGFAIYVPAILVSLVVGMILNKTSAGQYLDGQSLAHIGNFALEYLIVCAIGSMKLSVVVQNALALTVISAVGLLLTTGIMMVLPKLWLKKNWLENAMVMFGAWTGSTASGMMLLKVADPELETDAGSNLITATPLWQISTQTFYLTVAPMIIVTKAGFNKLAIGTAVLLVAALLVGTLLSRKS